MTQRSDGEWRALKNDGVFNSSMFLGNVYKAELARELEKAGFQLRYERNGTSTWPISPMSRSANSVRAASRSRQR
ncbi:relaxase domain-containing protein (plasmid) [Pseudomonas parakoreensis]